MTSLPRLKTRGRSGRGATAAACLGVAVVAAAWCSAPAGATFPGKNGEILFFGWDGGLFRTAPKSEKRDRLTPESQLTSGPDWAPDGRTFTYAHYGKIFIDRRGQGAPTQLTDLNLSAGDPSFSQGGRRIVFDQYYSDQARCCRIRLMRSDGSDQHAIPGIYGFDPAFSPDGDSIVFDHGSGIYTMRPDGSHLRRVVRRPQGRVEEPSFAPNGKSIVYMASSRFGGTRVATKRLSDGEVHYLTSAKGEAHSPVFSPNGNLVAYVSFRDHHPQKKSVFAVKPDGTGRRVLIRRRVNLYDGLSWGRR